MKRINVLHVITHLGNGGALDNTLLTVERLPRDRYVVHLAAGQLPPDEGYTSWEQRARQCADRLYLFDDLQRPVRPLVDLRACRQLTGWMRQQGYQIVHTHCAKAGVVGRIAARHAGVPVILHTCHAFGSQVVRDAQGTMLRRLAATAKKRLFTRLERYAGALSDRVITVCQQNQQQAIEQKLAPPGKIVTIYSGIDWDRLDVRADRTETFEMLELDPTRPLIAFIGRLAEQKAPLDFVAAAKEVLDKRGDAQFVIAGDGPLADQVLAAIGQEPRIKCVGFYQHVPELLSVLDVLAISSYWEGLGRTLTEAMFMGVPVAATAVDGIPELVTHRETGLLSPPGEPAALAQNILSLLDRPEEAQAMGRRARARIGSDFGADRMVERIDDLYQHLLRDKGLLPERAHSPSAAFVEEPARSLAS